MVFIPHFYTTHSLLIDLIFLKTGIAERRKE